MWCWIFSTFSPAQLQQGQAFEAAGASWSLLVALKYSHWFGPQVLGSGLALNFISNGHHSHLQNAKHILGFQKQRNGKPDQKRHYLIDLFKWAGTNTIRDGLALGSGGLNILTRFVTVGRTLLLVFSFLVSSFRVASFQIFFRSQLIFQWLCCPDFPTELCSYFKSIRLIRKINEPEL